LHRALLFSVDLCIYYDLIRIAYIGLSYRKIGLIKEVT
jgi:hypothetical protein